MGLCCSLCAQGSLSPPCHSGLFLWQAAGYLATDLPNLWSVFYSELFAFLFAKGLSFLIEENPENSKQAEKGGPNLVSHLT